MTINIKIETAKQIQSALYLLIRSGGETFNDAYRELSEEIINASENRFVLKQNSSEFYGENLIGK